MALRTSLGVLGLLGLLSCSRVSAGLANAPSLGGAQIDNGHVHDVIAG